jgi:uncharacterized membrane protein YphA (DoxX/SURF4 family)
LQIPYPFSGTAVQRLFSTFADGWPGLGLLLQRLLVGGALLYHGALSLTHPPLFGAAVPEILGAVAGILILAGLWTPVAGTVAAAVELWIAFSQPNNMPMAVILAVLGVSLAMIGPGAWSIDARLFGRKQIDPDL